MRQKVHPMHFGWKIIHPHPAKYFWKVGRFVGIFLPVKRQYSTTPTNYHPKIYPLGDAKKIQGLRVKSKSFFRIWGISAPQYFKICIQMRKGIPTGEGMPFVLSFSTFSELFVRSSSLVLPHLRHRQRTARRGSGAGTCRGLWPVCRLFHRRRRIRPWRRQRQ